MATVTESKAKREGEPLSDDKSVDWRIRTTSHLAKDVPAAYLNGPSHKAGALVVQVTVSKDAKGRLVGFTTPSAVALALSLAMKAADRAHNLQEQIEYSESVSPFGSVKSVAHESTMVLFDYFEQCMSVIAFSFQALEAYCNEAISVKVPESYELRRGKRIQAVTAEELERLASTEEKLGTILPDILVIPTPKGSRVWNDFVDLKKMRDATMHIKSRDSNPRVQKVDDLDEDTLFHRLLGTDVTKWVRTAVAMMDYFANKSDVPPWLEHIKKSLNIRTKHLTKNQSKQNMKPRGER